MSVRDLPRNTEAKFNVKAPGKGGRASFAIVKVHKKSKRATTLKLPDLDRINQYYKSSRYSLEHCQRLVQRIVDDLYREEVRKLPKDTITGENQRVLDEYWKAEYEHRELDDPSSMKNSLIRVIRALGEASLKTSDRATLQAAIDKAFSGEIQRTAVSRVNQLLKFLGRGSIRLRRSKKRRKKINYLDEIDFNKALSKVQDSNERALYASVFYSGLRIGEAFAVHEYSSRQSQYYCEEQLKREKSLADPKSNQRPVYVIEAGRKALEEWAKLPRETKYAWRNRRWAEKFVKACKAAEVKPITIHDLRHSYAVYLVTKGMPLKLVAESLGDSLLVAEEYYAGFVLVQESIETMDRILKGQK